VEIFKEHVIEVIILVSGDIELVESVGYVTNFIQVLWPDLTDVQIDQISVVGINLKEFFLIKLLCVKPSLNMNLLVG
jgi:hypothetical protein